MSAPLDPRQAAYAARRRAWREAYLDWRDGGRPDWLQLQLPPGTEAEPLIGQERSVGHAPVY